MLGSVAFASLAAMLWFITGPLALIGLIAGIVGAVHSARLPSVGSPTSIVGILLNSIVLFFPVVWAVVEVQR